MGLRIAWWSNSPTAPTGYGAQTAQVIKRMSAAGHDVHVISNYGHGAGTGVQNWNGIPVWPQGATKYSTDVADDIARAINPDLVITLYDVWVMNPDQFAGFPTLSWTPVDHDPVVPDVVRWLRGDGANQRPTIAMSEFGKRALADQNLQSIYIPHAIEKTFKPQGPESDSATRKKMDVPEDAFLIGIVAANIGTSPPRKMWVENLQAAGELMRAHDDVYLYIHTDISRGGGVPIAPWLQVCGVPVDRVRAVDPFSYRMGTTSEEDMARNYSAFDVLLACSGGEGFGIPVIEAMRSGTPAVVTDFSAQPELVDDTGWKVGYQLLGDLTQGSFFAMPFIHEIVEALEEAYGERGTDVAKKRSEMAAARGELYDADDVYQNKWEPLLEDVASARNRAKAEAAGIITPRPQLVDKEGQPLNDTIRPKGQKRRSNKRRG